MRQRLIPYRLGFLKKCPALHSEVRKRNSRNLLEGAVIARSNSQRLDVVFLALQSFEPKRGMLPLNEISARSIEKKPARSIFFVRNFNRRSLILHASSIRRFDV